MCAGADLLAEAAAPGQDFPWLESRFEAAPGVRRLRLGERTVLFCERRQQLFELNATADAIWRSLAAGHAPSMAIEDMRVLGARPPEALDFVTTSAGSWLAAGLLAPADVAAQSRGEPELALHLNLGDLAFCVALHGPAGDPLGGELACVFAQFRTEPPPKDAERLCIVAAPGGGFLFLDGAPLGLFAADRIVAEVKAVLTEALCRSLGRASFLLHAALLARRGQGLLISGGPGAGKTTLAVALAARGFGYGSDDVVTVSPDGRFRGIPFSPAVKAGAWDLAASYAPSVAGRPVHLRGDGQSVRFLPVDGFKCGPIEMLGWALTLDRRADAKPRLEPVEPIAMIGELFGGAYCPDHRLHAGTFEAFAAALRGVACRRLVYADLPQAIGLVEELVRG